MFNKNKEIKKACKEELLDEAQKVYNVNNKELENLLNTYIDNIEDNRKILNLKCDEVIEECSK
ncbi:hypothetical protein FDC45_15055 [Clostridium botulinum]|uniref:Uncharacterized protein n=1 Tax=Clostridium botulinum TaxID=1491 RepID=A0A846J9T0_CLOBO|nr:hypothetical protein [Clostridium botulinum]ACA53881.1 hypothetical protein CLK_0875 [Clostridium botulinum A3 str. Loch Maree]NFH66854.1 hypothetical protein [Clostridium botulinum]NFJ10629.1 hypothetical protein [Clostridium botulinum]NFK15549.1 hypothetical protein [Clostridium botulinum]NFM95327.1 hypothetical protein [Clostridium botulinum]